MSSDSSLPPPRVFTVGHSTREAAEFVEILKAHGIRVLVDVRRFPASRRHPHFAKEALEERLAAEGIRYVWMGESLGGRRRAGSEAAKHSSIRNEAFRAYAGHMETAEFRRAVADLLALAREATAAILCAEALWWRCHRSFVADYLASVSGVEVIHLFDARKSERHVPRAEARREKDRLVYDRPARRRRDPGLFAE